MFAFSSVNDFFYMSGHGVYVWSAWIITYLGILGLITWARRERQQFLKAQLRQLRRLARDADI